MPSPSSLAQFLPRLYHVPDAGRLSPAVLADICVGPGSAAAPISSAARFSARPPPPPFGLGGGGPVRLQVEGCAQGLAGGLTVSDMPQDPCPWVAEQCLACQHVVLKDWSDI